MIETNVLTDTEAEAGESLEPGTQLDALARQVAVHKAERDQLAATHARFMALRTRKQDELRTAEKALDRAITSGDTDDVLVTLAAGVCVLHAVFDSLERVLAPISAAYTNAARIAETSDTAQRHREQGAWEHKKALELMDSPRCVEARKEAEATARTGGRAHDADQLGRRAAYTLARWLIGEASRLGVDASSLANKT